MSQLRFASFRLLLCSFALVGLACKSTGGAPPVEGVRPADESRSSLLASVTIAPLDELTGNIDALSRTLGLPFAGKELVTMLAAQNRLDPAATAHLDGSRPIGLAFVAPKTPQQEPLGALVLSTRGPEATEKLVAALGTVAETQKAARKIKRPDGSVVWIAAHGTSLFASASAEGLFTAGALALEAQRPLANDVTVNIFPDAFARWRGTDVRTALAGFRKELIDEQITVAQRHGGPVPGAAERLIYETAIDLFLDPLGETASGALTLDLDAKQGLRFGLRVNPRPGSAFGKRIAAPAPYEVDPALFATGDADPIAGLWAMGKSPFWLEVYDGILAAQAKAGTRGAAEVGKHYQTLRPYLSGAGSGTMRLHKGALANDVVVPLQGNAPAAALEALAALAGSRGFTELLGEIYGKATPQVSARREREGLRTELAFPVRDRPGDPGTALKAFFGSATVAVLSTVSKGRLLMSTEPAASNRLAALAGPAARTPAAEIATALAETRGQDGLLYLDLWSFFLPTMAVAAKVQPQEAAMIGMITAMPGFATLKLPVMMTYKGGEALTADFRIPLGTLSNAAAVARPFLGMAR
jgi:hypothetical protein